MIAVDTNVLIAALREGEPMYGKARGLLKAFTEGRTPWALPIFVIGEFLRVATHPGARPPSPLQTAVDGISHLLASPTTRLLRPTAEYWPRFRQTLLEANATGTHVHDAQIIAVCLEHGADTIVSEDRGLRRFRGIRVLTIDEASG